MEKFIYVFSEEDKNTLLNHGFILAKEPKKKTVRKKAAEEAQEEPKEEMKVWIFFNKNARDKVLDSLGEYALSNILTF